MNGLTEDAAHLFWVAAGHVLRERWRPPLKQCPRLTTSYALWRLEEQRKALRLADGRAFSDVSDARNRTSAQSCILCGSPMVSQGVSVREVVKRLRRFRWFGGYTQIDVVENRYSRNACAYPPCGRLRRWLREARGLRRRRPDDFEMSLAARRKASTRYGGFPPEPDIRLSMLAVALIERLITGRLRKRGKMSDEKKSTGRTSQGLRDLLFDEIQSLRDGTSDAQRARSVAALADSILKSVSVELDYQKYAGDAKNAPLLGTLSLGGEAGATAMASAPRRLVVNPPVSDVELDKRALELAKGNDDRPVGDGVMQKRRAVGP